MIMDAYLGYSSITGLFWIGLIWQILLLQVNLYNN